MLPYIRCVDWPKEDTVVPLASIVPKTRCCFCPELLKSDLICLMAAALPVAKDERDKPCGARIARCSFCLGHGGMSKDSFGKPSVAGAILGRTAFLGGKET